MTTPRMQVRAMAVFEAKGRRPAQEDFALASQERGIFVVADGFGGPAPGAEAARLGCEGVRAFLEREAGDADATLPFVLRNYFSLAGNVLFNALIHANRKVISRNRGKAVHEKGGASVVAAYMDGDLLALANIGGCTAWLIRDGRQVELVAPRTLARLVEPFNPDPPGIQRAPLTSLGMSDDLEPEIFEYRIRPGDWLLLQTDGLGVDAREAVARLQTAGRAPAVAAAAGAAAMKGCVRDDNAAAVLVVF